MITIRISNIKKFLFFLLIIILSGSINFANAQPLGTFTFPPNPSIFPGLVTFQSGCVGCGSIDVVNVKNPPYSAKGDGVTNDAAAIQAALTVSANEGILFFPPGTYKITGAGCALTVGLVNKDTYIVGSGREISVIDATTCPDTLTVFNTIYNAGHNTFLIRDLTINGPTSGHSNIIGLGITNWNNAIIQNVSVNNFVPSDVEMLASQFTIINGNFGAQGGSTRGIRINTVTSGGIYNTYSFGVTIGNQGTSVTHVSIVDSLLDDGSPQAVLIVGNNTSDIQILNSLVNVNTTTGIQIGDGTTTPSRVTVRDTRVGPFGTFAVTNNIDIRAGVNDTVLDNVTTFLTSGGTDITDAGTNTRFINVKRNAGYNWIQQGTSVMGTTEKLGTGAGNYTTASASYVDIDNTNLKNIAVVPVGWKESCNFVASADSSTLAAVLGVAIADGNVVKKEQTLTQAVASDFEPISVQHSVLGDGASHTITAQWKVSAGTATIANSTATLLPNLSCTLMPFS